MGLNKAMFFTGESSAIAGLSLCILRRGAPRFGVREQSSRFSKTTRAPKHVSTSKTLEPFKRKTRAIARYKKARVPLTLHSRTPKCHILQQKPPRSAHPKTTQDENLPRMDSEGGVQLDGSAVKEPRKPPKISFAEQPLRPAGSRLCQPPKKSHAKSAKFAK